MLWGCKTLVAPLSFRPVSPRQGVSRGCAGGKASPPSCRQPRLCSCKSKRLVPAAAQPVPPPVSASPPASGQENSFLPAVRRSLELSQRGSECRWSCSCSCAPETSRGSVLLGMCSTRWVLRGPAPPVEQGLGKKRSCWIYSPSWGLGRGETQ